MNIRRIILITLFVLFVIGAMVAIYFVFFKPVTTPGPNANQNVNGGTLPSTNVNVNRPSGTNANIPVSNTNGTGGIGTTNVNASSIANGGLTQVHTIVGTNAQNVKLLPSGNSLRYYDAASGTFYETNLNGTDKHQLASQLFPDAQDITWSADGNKAAITFPDGSSIVYDFNAQRQYKLPDDTEDYSFDPSGNQLAYKYVPSNVEDRYIVVSNIDGSGLKFIEPIGDQAANVDINWSPNSDVVATFHKSVDAGSQEVYFIGTNKENYKSAMTEGRGFTGAYSQSGEQMIYSVYSSETNYNPELYIMNASGDAIGSGRTDLGLKTWPDKCTFSGSNLYCAVPQFLSPGSGLYPDQSSSSSDNFYYINSLTGTKELLATPNVPVSAKNLYISPDGSRLYFTNTNTGALESVQLP